MSEELTVTIANNLEALKPELARVNERLEREVRRCGDLDEGPGGTGLFGFLASDYRTGPISDGYGGREPVAQGDSAPAVEARLASRVEDRVMGGGRSRLDVLRQCLGLGEFEVSVILLCLAQELDPGYGAVFAYLQGDAGAGRPTVDLALTVFTDSAEERMARRRAFGPAAPLLQQGIVQLAESPYYDSGDNSGKFLSLEPRLVDYLLGIPDLDDRLLPFTELWDKEEPEAGSAHSFWLRNELGELTERLKNTIETGRPVHLALVAPVGLGRSSAAGAICNGLGRKLLMVDCGRLLESEGDPDSLVRLLQREAVLQDAVPCFRGIHLLSSPEPRARNLETSLAALFTGRRDITMTVGDGRAREIAQSIARSANHAVSLTLEIPELDLVLGKLAWRHCLAEKGLEVQEEDVDRLARDFCLSQEQIEDAVGLASVQALWRHPKRPEVSLEDLAESAAGLAGVEKRSRATRVQSGYSWDDLVLPEDRKRQLMEICSSYQHRNLVLRDWGFGKKGAAGKGLKALFVGSSGTGKTMAAEIISGVLGMELRRVEIPTVVSKYIGETEKNLDGVFLEAEGRNHILLFDEADALFGKRGEVRDSHDRYANIEVSYLLQKIEEFQGVAILTTNLPSNLDDAFLRRLDYTVEFPLPDEGLRLEMWRRVFPPEAPLHSDVDMDFMASRFQLSGGNIRNIAVGAAFLAAYEESDIEMKHVILATRREFLKMGKLLSEQDFGPYLEMSAA